MLLRWLMRPSVYEQPPPTLRTVPSMRRGKDHQNTDSEVDVTSFMDNTSKASSRCSSSSKSKRGGGLLAVEPTAVASRPIKASQKEIPPLGEGHLAWSGDTCPPTFSNDSRGGGEEESGHEAQSLKSQAHSPGETEKVGLRASSPVICVSAPTPSKATPTASARVQPPAGSHRGEAARAGDDEGGLRMRRNSVPPSAAAEMAPARAHGENEGEGTDYLDLEDYCDEEECHAVHCDDTFRGGRVHFFRQIPMFFFLLESFVAFTGMCLVQTTLESLIAPFRMFWRGFRLRDVLTTFYVLCGVASLHMVTPSDSRLYSSVYHIIRASSTIKLYVIFNMLELADKLLSAFNTDVIETTWTLIKSRRGPRQGKEASVGRNNRGEKNGTCKKTQSTSAGCPPALVSECIQCNAPSAHYEPRGGILEIFLLLVVSSATVMLHTIVLLCHVATINVAVNSEGSSLVGLLISNNFVEVKSVVLKKNTPESLLTVSCQDAVERVQHVIFIAAMLLQHVLTSEGPGSLEMGQIALIVFCEVAIDFLKHIFVARFNNIQLEVYKTFLHTCFLDVSLRRFLSATRLPVVTSYTSGKTDLVTCPTTFDLSHAHFIPNPAHRSAFVPFPYAGLLLWAAWPAVSAVVATSPAVALMCLALLLSVNAFLKTFTFSWASAFTYSIIRKEQRSGGGVVMPPQEGSSLSTPMTSSLKDRAEADGYVKRLQSDGDIAQNSTAEAPTYVCRNRSEYSVTSERRPLRLAGRKEEKVNESKDDGLDEQITRSEVNMTPWDAKAFSLTIAPHAECIPAHCLWQIYSISERPQKKKPNPNHGKKPQQLFFPLND